MEKSFSKRTAELLNTVRAYIISEDLIRQGERVCVGVSGGADSLCLLQVLYLLKEDFGIKVFAFHVNHNLRGCESEADQAFTEAFCKKRDIPLYVYGYDVKKIAKEEKKGIEETGRLLRQKAARLCMKETGAVKTAFAHHKNDSVETMLFNLARGTSLSGLKGIAPKTGDVIRPLLCCTRTEIEEMLTDMKISWRTDGSNLKQDYSRNKIRLSILPLFEKEINARSIEHMSQAASDIAEAEDIIKKIAKEKSEYLTRAAEDGLLIRPEIKNEGRLIGGCIIAEAIGRLTGSLVDIGRDHISAVRELFEKQTGRSVDLPHETAAYRTYEGVVLKKKKAKSEGCEKSESAALMREGIIRFGGFVFETRLIAGPVQSEKIPKKKYTKWFDYDKIKFNCCLRYKQEGDYLRIGKDGGRKKLKKYFIDEKIPEEARDKTVILASENRVFWVVGYRIGECCKVTSETETVIEIQAFREAEYDRDRNEIVTRNPEEAV